MAGVSPPPRRRCPTCRLDWVYACGECEGCYRYRRYPTHPGQARPYALALKAHRARQEREQEARWKHG